MIYFISDMHLNHDREFVYAPRGCNSVEQMNEKILRNWKKTIKPDDDVYVLGDMFLGSDVESIKNTAAALPGKIHLIAGNHDTPAKLELYSGLPNIVEISYAQLLKIRKHQFFLCHYPTLTAEYDKDPDRAVINLFGHTHSPDKFYEDNPFMYNVACDAHDCEPVSIDTVMRDIEEKIAERLGMSR